MLAVPMPAGQVIVLGPGDAFFINMKISHRRRDHPGDARDPLRAVGVRRSGAHAQERRIIRPWLPLALFFFALGCAVAYVILPYAMQFLLGFTERRTW